MPAATFSFEMQPPDAIVLSENVRRTIIPSELDNLRESIGELSRLGEGIAAAFVLSCSLNLGQSWQESS